MEDDPEPLAPACAWCHVPLEPLDDALPCWVCPACDEVSISV